MPTKKNKINKLLLALFLLMVASQIIFSASMIYKSEDTLHNGTPYKMLLEPIDPVDFLRGNYLELNFAQNNLAMSAKNAAKFKNKEDVFAVFSLAANGFLKLIAIQKEPPSSAEICIKTQIAYRANIYAKNSTKELELDAKGEPINTRLYLKYAFDRFYVNEFKAQAIETKYAQSTQNKNAYALVRIKNTNAMLENIFIDAKPLADFLAKTP